MDKYIFQIEMEVRDYEVDCENIVNNANYLHYLEHTRHKFCQHAGFSFKEMHESGIDPVLNKVEITYKTPLKSCDLFLSKLWIEMKGPRFIFHQDIFKKETNELVVSAIISCVCVENGKLTKGTILRDKFKDYFND